MKYFLILLTLLLIGCTDLVVFEKQTIIGKSKSSINGQCIYTLSRFDKTIGTTVNATIFAPCDKFDIGDTLR
jgi:hypothetical protein